MGILSNKITINETLGNKILIIILLPILRNVIVLN